MQDRPTAQELVEAVAGFIETEIIPTTADPRLKFRGRIAANVLSIVARELAAGDADLRAEHCRLLDLLGAGAGETLSRHTDLQSEVETMNRQLSTLVRAGDFDAPVRFDAALSVAEAALIDKLRVTNPRYLARVLDQ